MFRLLPAVIFSSVVLVIIIATGTFLFKRVSVERELTNSTRSALLAAVPPGNDRSEVERLSIAFSGRHGYVAGTIQSTETLLALKKIISQIQNGQHPLNEKISHFNAALFLPATLQLKTTDSLLAVSGELPSEKIRAGLITALKKACTENHLDLDTRELAVDPYVSRPSWAVSLAYLIPELIRLVSNPSLHLHGNDIATIGGQVKTTADRIAVERLIPTGLPMIGDQLESLIETIEPEAEARFRLVITPEQVPSLEGLVPTKALRNEIMKILNSSIQAEDKLQTFQNLADPQWIPGLPKAATAFSDAVWTGQMSFEGNHIALEGKTRSSEAKSQLLKTIRDAYPEYDLTDHLEVTPYSDLTTGNDIASLKLRNAVTETVVYFKNNQSTVPADASDDLKKLAEIFNATSRPTLTIYGHPDTIGNAAYNRRLAAERSRSVLKHLESIGVDSNRMILIDKKDNTEAPSTKPNWKHARRVEFGLR